MIQFPPNYNAIIGFVPHMAENLNSFGDAALP